MAITARQLIYKALRNIQVTASEETPTAAQAQDGLRDFNEMMHSLKRESIPLDWRTLALDDAVPLPEEDIRGFTAMLSIELAPGYGKEVDPAIAVIAERQRLMLQAVYKNLPSASFDEALLPRIWRTTFDITKG